MIFNGFSIDFQLIFNGFSIDFHPFLAIKVEETPFLARVWYMEV